MERVNNTFFILWYLSCTCHSQQTIFWLENMKGRDHSEDLGIGERITLDWILEK
jgi:hypothetical protein